MAIKIPTFTLKTQIRPAPKHTFRFKVQTIAGEKPTVILAKAAVTRAKKMVEIVLTAADVRRSIELKGVGNTATCSMAVCAKRSAAAFPHKVEGYIDWQYATAFVVSKVKNGLPVECVAYQHRDSIAKINDTKGGQEKLLAELVAGGSRKIRLHPIKARAPRPGTRRGKIDGSRASKPGSTGAAARFAFSQLGGVS